MSDFRRGGTQAARDFEAAKNNGEPRMTRGGTKGNGEKNILGYFCVSRNGLPISTAKRLVARARGIRQAFSRTAHGNSICRGAQRAGELSDFAGRSNGSEQLPEF
jgi:hypothetical protein